MGLVDAFPRLRWQVLTLPARHFNWRIRGNPLSWAMGEPDKLGDGYDLVIATSMTDLATLRGLSPGLSRARTIIYFHENQFAYPTGGGIPRRLEPCMVTIYGALAADTVIFNSQYNRRTFLDGASALLSRMPDGVPADVIEAIRKRSRVIPVPLAPKCFAQREHTPCGPFTILWNHRWEYDKGPERFLHALRYLSQSGTDFRLNIIGQRFRKVPEAFDTLKREFGPQINHCGPVDDGDYYDVLAGSQVVVSTAIHDFQGLAVLEAAARGCVPLVPDRLAYPEFFAPQYRYPGEPGDPDREARTVASRLAGLETQYRNGNLPPAPDLRHLSWERLLRQYAGAMGLHD